MADDVVLVIAMMDATRPNLSSSSYLARSMGLEVFVTALSDREDRAECSTRAWPFLQAQALSRSSVVRNRELLVLALEPVAPNPCSA